MKRKGLRGILFLLVMALMIGVISGGIVSAKAGAVSPYSGETGVLKLVGTPNTDGSIDVTINTEKSEWTGANVTYKINNQGNWRSYSSPIHIVTETTITAEADLDGTGKTICAQVSAKFTPTGSGDLVLWVGNDDPSTGGVRITTATHERTYLDFKQKSYYDPTTNTLVLDNYSYNGPGTEEGFGAAVYAPNQYHIKIILNGNNTFISTYTPAVPSVNSAAIAGNFIFSGSGSLTAKAINGKFGINGSNMELNITEGTIIAEGKEKGITCKSLTISGGRIETKGSTGGIEATGDLTINGGTIKAIGGIRTWGKGNITINGGTVEATDGLGAGLNLDMGTLTIRGGKIKSVGKQANESLPASGFSAPNGQIIIEKGVESFIAWGEDGSLPGTAINCPQIRSDIPLARWKKKTEMKDYNVIPAGSNFHSLLDGYTTMEFPVPRDDYEAVEGYNQRYNMSGGEFVIFRIGRGYRDEYTLDLFEELWLDGRLIDPRYYRTSRGSVILELDPAALGSTSASNHELGFKFYDGVTYDVPFSVGEETPSPTPAPTSTSAPTEEPEKEMPKTGDAEPVLLWLALLTLGMLLIKGLLNKKPRNGRR